LFERATGVAPDGDDVEIVRTDEGYKIRLGEAMVFNTNSDKLKRSNIAFLYELGKRLGRLNLPIQVEGHTDDAEVTAANPESGWQLSLSRSTNIARFFVEASGFPQSRISIVGHGNSHPISDN